MSGWTAAIAVCGMPWMIAEAVSGDPIRQFCSVIMALGYLCGGAAMLAKELNTYLLNRKRGG